MIRRSTLRRITATLVVSSVLLLAILGALPRLIFWALERYAEREGGLQ